MVLHMLWNSPFQLPFELKHIGIGVVGWFVVFGLVQQGLHQIREEQAAATLRTGVRRIEGEPGPKLVQAVPPPVEAQVAQA
jgi:hypothetical protein